MKESTYPTRALTKSTSCPAPCKVGEGGGQPSKGGDTEGVVRSMDVLLFAVMMSSEERRRRKSR